MSDLKAYLADKYMSGPKRDAILARSSDPNLKKKKKKIKNEDYIGGSSSRVEGSSAAGGSGSGGLVLKDDDEWKGGAGEDEDMDGDDAPVIGKDLATFQKSKSSWATVGSTSLPVPAASTSVSASGSAGPSSPPADIKPDSDAPAVAAAPVQMTKRRGGLRTAKQMKEEAERAAAEREPSPDEEEGGPNGAGRETIHRDASGRVIDVAKLKEEELRLEEEAKRKELEKKEWTKGIVQRQQREERAREEREMAQADVGRSRDDVRMNREMREVDRWNDPAAEFLTKKKKRGPRRPRYEGGYAPNRFGIPPGYRWDGVDRSNGFEKKYFQAQNTASRKALEHAQWSMEDM
ncbi:pre-mRNA-splicing factor CWC26 [Kwoniella heveanensis CBS 569]|nr:pre-mRNA-splicing factor CWC26 [Kwoniella heveanensis CBS 569]